MVWAAPDFQSIRLIIAGAAQTTRLNFALGILCCVEVGEGLLPRFTQARQCAFRTIGDVVIEPIHSEPSVSAESLQNQHTIARHRGITPLFNAPSDLSYPINCSISITIISGRALVARGRDVEAEAK